MVPQQQCYSRVKPVGPSIRGKDVVCCGGLHCPDAMIHQPAIAILDMHAVVHQQQQYSRRDQPFITARQCANKAFKRPALTNEP
jgi:hypothetical protein